MHRNNGRMRPFAGRLESGVNQVHGHSLLDSSCAIIDPAAAAPPVANRVAVRLAVPCPGRLYQS